MIKMLPNLIKSCLSKEDLYAKIYNVSHKGSYISYIRGQRCKSERAFFFEISASLQFPYYFGDNWAALDECLCDLEWLQFDSIFLVVDDFNLMFCGDKQLQERLIKYFNIMINYWRENGVPVEIWLNSTEDSSVH